jgi:RNA polymerase sigma-70 factor (ECF subfamily)
MTTQEPKTPSLRSALARGEALKRTGGNEAELVASARSGCSPAFEQLYKRYNRTLYAIALRMLQNREDAEDVVQETFRHALLNLSKFRGDALFLTWLTRIVINDSLITIRCRKRKRELDAGESSEAALAEAVDSTPTPEKRCENREVQIAIHQAISSLHSKLRKVVLLRELNGCTTIPRAKRLTSWALPFPQQKRGFTAHGMTCGCRLSVGTLQLTQRFCTGDPGADAGEELFTPL